MVGSLFKKVLAEGSNEVVGCYENNVNSAVAAKLLELDIRQPVLITEVSEKINVSIRLSAKSKVLTNVGAFQINEDVLNEFIRPNSISVMEAKGSLQKRRFSLEGNVLEVGELVETPTYKRRCLKLGTEGCSIAVMLWGEVAVGVPSNLKSCDA
ncbi:uncharacterized protein [Antedon mediterranea]|uniref:uncharacterized protein isoform X1 n=1 Tax=Antedon mediterranea TaxID=105859 RepID=UPI003AF54558